MDFVCHECGERVSFTTLEPNCSCGGLWTLDNKDISFEMEDCVPTYKYAELDEVLGGVLVPVDARLAAIEGNVFGDYLKCTDSLMNCIAERLPKMANPTE